MTPDNESVIKSNVQKCWLNEKYFVYLMMQNTEQMKISKAQREKLWNPQMGFNFKVKAVQVLVEYNRNGCR